MIGGVASSCRPPRDCNRRDRKRSQRNNGDRNTGARWACRCRSRPPPLLPRRTRSPRGLALGDKADLRSPGVGIALPEPEKYAAVPSEALEVGMPLGAILGRHRLVEKRQVEVYDVHEFELGVGPLFRDFVDPFGDGLAVATGPRASEDDGNSQHGFSCSVSMFQFVLTR